ncbi:alpha/beta fold hydrolase [Sinomonas sp. ASV322]|uniref:alpha/beta fold hydrolase n=1 Tax=Sinomonas sp. ASV322 TaxID=3041920 RepID=UPI0027DB637F|nr:alpha/beta fold hydrolase [Sinomonas sp. ASV322]MDQ4500947.1 alpha/beta fold hydrolase [Sinomonas sp. ASV322]
MARHRVLGEHAFRGLRATEHVFAVPLDHGDPDGEAIDVFARELISSAHPADVVARLPWLVYLQGGPGGRGNRVTSLSGWMKEAAKEFRILMLDQRGTGLSTPADRTTLPLRGEPAQQAEYLSHFRADSIVLDCEAIRRALGSGPWTVYGQSFGGFCTLTYLSIAPNGLREALITGGLAPLDGPAERVYRATYARLAARNAEYFSWYPEDRARATEVIDHLRAHGVRLPDGSRLSPERFQLVGNLLGGNTRVDSLHHLLEDAFTHGADGDRLSDSFLTQVQSLVTRAPNPLYAVLHESIYAQGEASAWAAWRVLDEYPDFRADAAEPLLLGEMVCPWLFEQDPALAPLAATARLLAEKSDWGRLYDPARLAENAVPVAAAVYRDDIYVDRALSLETAGRVRGLRVWETPDFHHDGISDDGEAIFARLLAMARAA